MSIAEWKSDTLDPLPAVAGPPRPRLHHIREVRRQQGISLRSASRRLQMDPGQVRLMEEETSDMPLSMLYRWQQALEVPVASLLVDSDDPLSGTTLNRARLVRLMKTAAAIHENAHNKSLERMALMLIEQLVEIMPELKEVGAWHSVGQRRSLDECGRIAERPLPDEWLFANGH